MITLRLNPLDGYTRIKPEQKYGQNSRIDLLLEADNRPPCYVEIKNVHLMRRAGLAEFPDSVTARGAKHLDDLAHVEAALRDAVTANHGYRMGAPSLEEWT